MRTLGPTELILIFSVFLLLFGAKKLPDLARGSGRAMRIFKAESKGLRTDEVEGFPSIDSVQRAAKLARPVAGTRIAVSATDAPQRRG